MSSETHAAEPLPRGPAGEVVGDLLALGATLAAVFERLARREGNMTLFQLRTLEALRVRAPEPLEPGEIAQAVQTGSNHVSLLLDQLEAQHLVRREAHPHDGRRRLVYLTVAGHERWAAIARHVAALETRILETALSPPDRAELQRLAGLLQNALDEMKVPLHRLRPGP